MLVQKGSLTDAWAEAFLATYDAGTVTPLVVTMSGFRGMPLEDLAVRNQLDELLCGKKGAWPTGTTASTIFPSSMWKPGVARVDLYARYDRLYRERISKIRQNRRGTYFSRLTSFGPEEINQLEKIIEAWDHKITRRSAFVAAVFDPRSDHKATPYLGFPCMHEVCFAPEGDGGFAVTGFYAKQDIFDRGYGNYLGLARLGVFMADAFGRDLTRVTCVTSIAGLTINFTKGELRPLAESLRAP